MSLSRRLLFMSWVLWGISGVAIAQVPTWNDPSARPRNAEVEHFCADCHAMPNPQAFPRTAWGDEVKRGYRFYANSGRKDLTVPKPSDVSAFFRQYAPERIELPVGAMTKPTTPARFKQVVFPPRDTTVKHAIAGLHRHRLSKTSGLTLIGCDMQTGDVSQWMGIDRANEQWRPLARLDHPAHSEACDLDGDGLIDLVVADLGTFAPSDKLAGRVAWLRRTSETEFEIRDVMTGLGRVADVQPVDVDHDDDLDLLVAEFGWQTAGRVLLLRNTGNREQPKFELEQIDGRHGTIHVSPIDLNKDGHTDFVALISQEHEVIEAFINDGTGRFTPTTVFSANEPSWGSSGIQLVDMDGDGDSDILYSNGDTFDSFYLKPFHGIQWLENTGAFPWTMHRLTNLPGVHRAIAADLDNDGDLDIAACALLSSRLTRKYPEHSFDSLIWLEQTSRGAFQRHTLKNGKAHHAALEAFDVNQDGLLDLVLGEFAEQPGAGYAEVWVNQQLKSTR